MRPPELEPWVVGTEPGSSGRVEELLAAMAALQLLLCA